MKKNIVLINTKGGVGKTTLGWHLMPFLLQDRDFQIVEIDDNNNTSLAFGNSELLRNKVVSCNISKGTEKLEELVVENMIEADKITIIDSGGGNDSRAVLNSMLSQNLTEDTLFVIPYLADFSQLKNLFETVELVKDFDFIVVLNNYIGIENEDEMFRIGNEEFDIPNIEKVFKDKFFIVKRSNLFSFATSIHKQTIYDFAKTAFDYSRSEMLEYAKEVTGANKEKMTQMYRSWKISDNAKDYLESKEIEKLRDRILK
ncbi:AAA family ATPase [Sulfurimonas sp.]|uniref:ParA family protein n=1 Tax=Sulfurimonas sp. TaxID=2022749 RepID=UPI0025DDD770|nr:AAA family ATPase [Sulfurimonas sp.]MCK9454231.1 ParA family protein [Sulfurimonas sp.]